MCRDYTSRHIAIRCSKCYTAYMKQLLSHLRTVGTPSIYRKGSSIFFQGEVPRHATVILDGVVKAYTISPDGDESIVNLYGKGSIIPIAWLSDQSPVALFNYDAVNDVRVLKLNKTELLGAISSNPHFQKEYLEYNLQSQAGLMLRVTGLVQARASSKICYTLYFLMFRYGIEKQPGIYEIDLKITQSMLANLIGQTRESTAKNLKALKELDVIDYSGSTYFVNKVKLEQHLGEDSFRNLDLNQR